MRVRRYGLVPVLGILIGAVVLNTAGEQRLQLPVDVGRIELELGPARVVVFGTGLSAPTQIRQEILEGELAQCRNAEVTLSRVTGSGRGSTWARGQLDEVASLRPDLILMEFSINDADIRDGIWLYESVENHQAILRELRQRLPRVQILLLTMSPAHGPRGWVRPRLSAYYRAYERLAVANRVALLDLNSRWRQVARENRGLDDDGLHPDPGTASAIILPPMIKFICSGL